MRCFSEVADLYTRIPPTRPTNNTTTPEITLSNGLPVISGWKNPASNAKNITKYTYLKPVLIFDEVSLNELFEIDYKINF